MKRAHLFLTFTPLVLAAACESGNNGATTTPGQPPFRIPAIAVNDPCSAYTTSSDCAAKSGQCTWTVGSFGVAGEASPPAACVTTSTCAGLSFARCSARTDCSWSGISPTQSAPALCPVGADVCGEFGYCYDRPAAGSACHCLQPLVCPSNLPCPAVQCDCPPPEVVDGGHATSGGGTCTCSCPACGPGETCPPCDCSCEGGGGGGSGGSGGGCGTGAGGTAGGSVGTGTCTCNCPECPAGEACPACSCACSSGSATTMTALTPAATGTASAVVTDGGSAPVSVCGCPACPANSACAPCGCGTTPADPCTAHTDAASCVADTGDSCGWTSLNIECITTPCPTGSCARMSSSVTPDGGGSGSGGGCGCACPACVSGQPCPPCTCNCCQAPAPVTLQPASGGAATSAN
ncbi:MAG TPA: hypothetical protein VKZ18_17630 [Polyangia bacterium]|nr:hypothetical protein [Polyangia bacterium]